jgi:hypothetical protein
MSPVKELKWNNGILASLVVKTKMLSTSAFQRNHTEGATNRCVTLRTATPACSAETGFRNRRGDGALALFQEGTMSKHFDPAPLDKHAEKPGRQGHGADKHSDELRKL